MTAVGVSWSSAAINSGHHCPCGECLGVQTNINSGHHRPCGECLGVQTKRQTGNLSLYCYSPKEMKVAYCMFI